jgi:hypothetical protein
LCRSATAREPGHFARGRGNPTSATAGNHETQLLHGYRFAKRQGKSNSNNALKSASNKHFCDFAAARAGNAFTFDSLRYLNRPSNFVRHDRACKPADGERDRRTFANRKPG